jgi:membrane fusion protein, multidrug efflux system
MKLILTLLRFSWGWMLVASLMATGCSPAEESVANKANKPSYQTIEIKPQVLSGFNVYDGSVEAVRQTELAAQVMGEITVLNATVGQTVKKNQILIRLDSQAANQIALASNAQLASTRAQFDLAQQEYERQKQLYAKNYISQSALQSAEATYKSAKAQVNVQSAQTSVTQTQSNFHLIKAPYDGVISALPVTLGDMATPGKTLLTVYDTNALRVTVAIPQSIVTMMENISTSTAIVTIDDREMTISNIHILPAADQATHTRTVRLNLPQNLTNIAPGMHVTVSFPINNITKISIPISALVKHTEMTGVYVMSQSGEPLLRQLRLGETFGDQVEVLSGLSIGEKIAIEPQTVSGSL